MMKSLTLKKISVVCSGVAAVCWVVSLICRIIMMSKGAEVSGFTLGLNIVNAVCWSLVFVLWLLEYRQKKQAIEQGKED